VGPWDESPEHKEPGEELAEKPESEDDDEPGKPFPDPRSAIMGPTTTTFPRNDGWLLPGQVASDTKRKLSDFTIHTVSAHLTSIITKDKVPNCVKNWEQDVGPNIPFDKVFASMGTPLSDATEERQWRKLVHRATFVRNRKHEQAPQNQCRLCGRAEETIMHLFRCEQTKPLWKACISFCVDTLGADTPTKLPEAIIFNVVSPEQLLPEDCCAFLRHAYNQFYHDF
jgi:hypothetical protein